MTLEQLEQRVRTLEGKMQELETIGPLGTQHKTDKPASSGLPPKKEREDK
jgi:hypothetical protein